MLSLYASAFGSYAPNLLAFSSNEKVNFHVYASAIIVLATAINYYSIKVVSRIESYAVTIKLIILISFVFVGAYGLFGNVNLEQLNPSNWESPIQLLAGGMVIFVAYEGFELIANAAPDIVHPEKNISRAYYYSVGFVVILYCVIAVVTVGSLPFTKIADAEDYVLAEAAKPMLGKIGFTIITIAALISTFSAINASLYGGSRVNFEIAQDDELPHHFLSKIWNQPVGLLITALATMVMVNLLNLESISTAGSIGFILIFGVVNFVAYKLSREIRGMKLLPILGTGLSALALIVLIKQELQSSIDGVLVAGGIILFCFLIEWLYKKSES